MAFFKSKEDRQVQVDFDHLPQHIAIIMDGNGRWAKKRGLPRTAGHAAGAENFRTIATYCKDIGLDYLTAVSYTHLGHLRCAGAVHHHLPPRYRLGDGAGGHWRYHDGAGGGAGSVLH